MVTNNCDNCIFADKEKLSGINFIKTFTCSNKQSQYYKERVRPHYSCDSFKEIDFDYLKKLDLW